VAEGKASTEPTIIERWLQEQQQWQRTLLGYLDSMVKNEEFLVHLGNAMRGSLLAGKPYPTAYPGTAPEPSPADDRLDQILFALHQLQGQLQDLGMTLDEIREGMKGQSMPPSASRRPRNGDAEKPSATAPAPRSGRTRRRK
jgi:hypothetical protein